MNTFFYLLPPVLASIFGVFVIVYNKKVCVFLQAFWERAPRYDKTMFKDLSVRPIYVIAIGVIYTLIAVVSFIERLKSVM